MKVGRYIDTKFDNPLCPHVDEKKEALVEIRHAPLHPLIVSIADAVRSDWGAPLIFTAGVRCPYYQEVLRRQGYRTAEISTHFFGAALDVQPLRFQGEPRKEAVKALAEMFIGYEPDIRLFTATYDFEFLHVDVIYEVPREVIHKTVGVYDIPKSYRPRVRDFLN